MFSAGLIIIFGVVVIIVLLLVIAIVVGLVILCKRHNSKNTILFSTNVPAITSLKSHLRKDDWNGPLDSSHNSSPLGDRLVNIDSDLRHAPVGGIERLTLGSFFHMIQRRFKAAIARRQRAAAQSSAMYGAGSRRGSGLPDGDETGK